MSILCHREDPRRGHQEEVCVIQLHVEGDVSIQLVLEATGIPQLPQTAVKLENHQADEARSVTWWASAFDVQFYFLTIPNANKPNEQQYYPHKTPGRQHIPSQFQLGSERWLPHPRLLEIHCYLTPCLQSHLASHCCPRRMEPVSQSRKEEMYRYRPRWNTMRGPLHPPNNSSANTKPDFIQTTAKASPPSFLGF